MDHLLTGTLTIKSPSFDGDALSAPRVAALPTLYADLPCRRQDVSDRLTDAFGQTVMVERSRWFLRSPGPIPRKALLISEGQTFQLAGNDTRRAAGALDTFIVIDGILTTP